MKAGEEGEREGGDTTDEGIKQELGGRGTERKAEM